jgi:phage virion morphogenesis protein
MAGVSLSVTAKDLGAAAAKIDHVARATEHAAPLMKRIGAVLEASARKRFRSQTAPDGSTWRPSIRVQRSGGTTLIDKGHLRDSITHDADDRHAVIGSNLIYAAIHQTGGVIRAKSGGVLTFNIPGVGWRRVSSVTIPARPYLGVSEEDRVELNAQTDRYIAQAAT